MNPQVAVRVWAGSGAAARMRTLPLVGTRLPFDRLGYPRAALQQGTGRCGRSLISVCRVAQQAEQLRVGGEFVKLKLTCKPKLTWPLAAMTLL